MSSCCLFISCSSSWCCSMRVGMNWCCSVVDEAAYTSNFKVLWAFLSSSLSCCYCCWLKASSSFSLLIVVVWLEIVSSCWAVAYFSVLFWERVVWCWVVISLCCWDVLVSCYCREVMVEVSCSCSWVSWASCCWACECCCTSVCSCCFSCWHTMMAL